jgi:UDP-3-O-[3-hydroxymyristoyl] glucosamine N-acyltransferase
MTVPSRPVHPVRASEVAAAVGGTLVGPDLQVTGVRPAVTLAAGALSFLTAKQPQIAADAGAILIVRHGVARRDANAYIEVDRPRLAFAWAISRFFERRPAPGVASSARVSPEATLAPSVWVGEHAVIERGVEIGARTRIHHGAVVCEGTSIGTDGVIGPGALIGATGFGYERDANGVPHHLPHIGSVRIGDHVHVGANATIARGTISETEVGDHTKIGPLAVIQHNVRIGKSCLIASHAVVSGSSNIGDECWLGPNCTIRQARRIGHGATIGLGVLVLEDVPPYASVMGHAGISVGDAAARRIPGDAPLAALASSARTSLDEAIDEVFRRALKLDASFPLADTLTPEQIPGWDSLGHLEMLLQMQQHFEARLEPEAVADIASLGDLRAQLHRCLTARQPQS